MSEALESQWRQVVESRANQTALCGREQTLTFGQLDQRARHVADLLRTYSAPALAIRGRDHASAVIGMVGALLARVPFVLVDHQLSETARGHVHRLINGALWLDELSQLDRARSHTAPRSVPVWRTSQADDAYMLFTSGSTGLPKGARIGRDNLESFIAALGTRLQLGPDDTWLQVSSLGFDVIIEEVFPVLYHGGTVAIRLDPYDPDPQSLHDDLATSTATIVELSTRYWYEYKRWLDASGLEPPSTLRLIIVGGERMDPAPYRDWQARGRTPLIHVYGLTECTVTSTMYSGVLAPNESEVPIGVPLANSTVTIDVAAASDWSHSGVGEIVLGGSCVGRGYVDDDAATAARFVLSSEGALTYRTGDLGYLDHDGQLVFAGRRDEQVKIRGRRVELAEIDHVLSSVPGIETAAAVLEPGEGRLIAFVCPASSTKGSPAPIFAAHVPQWAVPSEVHVIDSIPVTPHGKTDRNELLRLVEAHKANRHGPPGAQPDEPGDIGRVLEHMRRVLGRPDLAADDDFFDYGGNSLLTLELVTRLRKSLGPEIRLRPRTLFVHRTARAVAAQISMQRNQPSSTPES